MGPGGGGGRPRHVLPDPSLGDLSEQLDLQLLPATPTEPISETPQATPTEQSRSLATYRRGPSGTLNRRHPKKQPEKPMHTLRRHVQNSATRASPRPRSTRIASPAMPITRTDKRGRLHDDHDRDRPLTDGGPTLVAVTAVTGDTHLTTHDLEQKRAYEAAKAGIDNYAYHLHGNNSYWTACARRHRPHRGQSLRLDREQTSRSRRYRSRIRDRTASLDDAVQIYPVQH